MKFLNIRCNNRTNPDCIDNTPTFSWNFAQSYERDVTQVYFTIEVYDSNQEMIYAKKVRSSRMQFTLPVMNLKPLSQYFWTVTVGFSNQTTLSSPRQSFSTGLLGHHFSEYGAQWITGTQKYEECAISFNKCFQLEKEVKSAEAYFFGTAWQQVSVNGQTLKDDCFLLPPNTCYLQKCIYEKYDLKDALQCGNNEVSVLLGGGYNSNYSQWGWRVFCGKGLIGFIDILFCDGTKQRIVTDESWEIYSSKISYCDIYNGERYDANLVPMKLENAVAAPDLLNPFFVADEMPSVKVLKIIEPVSCVKQGRDYIYDMGENFAGIARISLSAPQGSKISMQFSELLYANGEQRLYTNGKAEARDEYICSGEGTEEYTPRFTYHGYRYIKVSGITKAVKNFHIVGVALSADVTSKSRFICSDGVINQIHENARRSLRSNLATIPTDCPMRNERTPCLMDSVCVEIANIYNFDMQGFYTKWLDDILVAEDHIENHGNPDWDGDRIILAYRMLRYYDDTTLIRKCYSDLKNYVRIFEKKTSDYLWYVGFGDWCHPNEDTGYLHGSEEVVNTCMLWDVCFRMAEIARALKKTKDEAYYMELSQKIQEAFRKKFLHEDGIVNKGAHVEQVMPLYVGMLSEEEAQAVFRKLVDKLTTEPMDLGIFGITALADVLPKYKASDLLYDILQNPNYPGYLYQIANGATSLWEQWSFVGAMPSHNHAMFAGIENAFYGGFAGIQPIEYGYRTFEIKPRIPQKLNFLECDVETACGVIGMKYNRNPSGMDMHFSIPVNTWAYVYLPYQGKDYVLFHGDVMDSDWDTDVCLEDGYYKVKLGSGHYNFRFVKKELVYDNSKKNDEKIY